MVDGEYGVVEAALHLEQGLPFVLELDGYGAELVSRLDGTQTVGQVLEEVAAVLGYEGEPDLELVRTLVELGFARPA